jgi:hypothetical protein
VQAVREHRPALANPAQAPARLAETLAPQRFNPARVRLVIGKEELLMAEITPHPLADVLPPMTAKEYAELRDSIRVNGQREPITLHSDGRILDGRHRARACAELGMPVASKTFAGPGRWRSCLISM